MSAARRHRAARLDDLCVGRPRRGEAGVLARRASAPTRSCGGRWYGRSARPPATTGGPAAGSSWRTRWTRDGRSRTRRGRAAALAEALKHPRHAAARASNEVGRLGDAGLSPRAGERGGREGGRRALVRRARALYGDAAAAATTTVAAPAPLAAQQRNRVTARVCRLRRAAVVCGGL